MGADADVTREGLARPLVVDPRLQETAGELHHGLAAGTLVRLAMLSDRFGAPPTAVDTQFLDTIPLGAGLIATIRDVAAAHTDVSLVAEGRRVVDGGVELGGYDVVARVADLEHLATTRLTEPQVGHLHCWVCGSQRPDGLELQPRPTRDGTLSIPWIPEDDSQAVVVVDRAGSLPTRRSRRADTAPTVDPAVVVAALTCPARWSTAQALGWVGARAARLTHLHVRFFRALEIFQPVRVVARHDPGPSVRARSAIVDEEGLVYAVASVALTPTPDADG